MRRQFSEKEVKRINDIIKELQEIFDAESISLEQTRTGFTTATNDFEIEIYCSHKEF